MSREDNEVSKHYQETLEAGKFLNNRELVRVLVNNAWHSLISVSIGWYAIRKALKEGNRRRIMQISSLFGLFWGFWSITWWAEEKRITPLSDIQSTYCYPVFFSPLLTGYARGFNFSPLK